MSDPYEICMSDPYIFEIGHQWRSWPHVRHAERHAWIKARIDGRSVIGLIFEGHCEYHFETEDDLLLFKMRFG